jgi:hypothetical protein
MELQTVFGQIILFDKEAERPPPEMFLRIDGALYDMKHIKSVPPIPDHIVEVIIKDEWAPSYRDIQGPFEITVRRRLP